ATNTVTFKSETNNRNNVTLRFNSGSANNYVVRFDSSEYVTFKLMSINSLNATYSRIIEFTGMGNYNSVEDCILDMAATTSTSSAAVYDYFPFSGEGNLIKGNSILDGYYGVYLYGSSASRVTGFILDGNSFDRQYYYAIYSYYHDNFKVLNN